jgi:uncharacterized membrane protein
MSGPAPARWWRDPWLWAAVLVGAALRFTALGRQSFWYDEVNSVKSAWGEPAGSLWSTVLNVHGPLYLVLLKAWMALVGNGEAAVRFLSALVGTAGIVVFHRVAAGFLERNAARAATLLLALSPFHLWYSQEARNYALLFVLATAGVPLFLAEVEQRTRGSFWAAALVTVGACLSNLSGTFLLAFQAVYAVTAGRRRGYPVARLVVYGVIVVVLLSPWLLRGAGMTGPFEPVAAGEGGGAVPVKGESPPGLMSIPFTLYAFSFGFSAGPSVDELKLHRWHALLPHLPYLLVGMAAFVGVAAAGVWSLRRDRERQAVILAWLALPLLLVALFSSLNLKAPNPRYAAFAFAPWVLLLGSGVTGLAGAARRGARTLAVIAAVALAAVSVRSDVEYFTNPRYWRPDARSAGELLRRDGRLGDGAVVYSLTYPVNYYVAGAVPLLKPLTRDFANRESMEAFLDTFLQSHDRVWVVQCQGWWLDRDDRFVDVCRERLRLVERWEFPGVPVYLFEG